MSYAGILRYQSLSGIEPWGRSTAETDEVYLWRSRFLGANIRTQADMQAIAAAVGKNPNLGFDLRGIAVESTGPGNEYTVDAAYTTKVPRVFTIDPTIDTAEDIARKVQVELTDRFPGIQVSGAHFDEINDDDPKHPALDFWRSQPVLYDAQFLGSIVPTDAFARFEGLFQGKAEDGIGLKKWPKEQPGPGPGPGPNGNGSGSGSSAWIWWLAGTGVAMWLILRTPQGYESRRPFGA